jgi:endonuclease/exonuclease/phosphatase family metal-dependent hydrolase
MVLVSCGPIKNYDDPSEPFYEGHYVQKPPVPKETVKVVSWNLSFAENLDSAINALTCVDELMEADILLLQEMDEAGVELLAQTLGYNYVYYPASIHRRHNRNFGNAVLTKWEIIEHEKIVLPKPASSNKHSRNAVKAIITIGDQEVIAYSAHFETFWILQPNNQRQVAFLADKVNKGDELVFIGGDFNSLTRGSIFYLEQRLGQASLQRLSKNTGHTFEYFGIKLTLDHIFASGVEEFEAGVWRGSDASDHFPLWTNNWLQVNQLNK